jgi:hypothetical protein
LTPEARIFAERGINILAEEKRFWKSQNAHYGVKVLWCRLGLASLPPDDGSQVNPDAISQLLLIQQLPLSSDAES